MTDQARGVTLTALGVLAIVPDSLLIRLIDAPPLTVAFWRAFFVAATIGAGLALWHRGRLSAVMLGLGRAGLGYAACVAVATMAFVISVQLTTVANTVFIVSLAPVFAALWSRLFLGERLSRRMAWTIPLCLFGALVIASGSASVAGASLAGDLLALLAAASLAAAFTVARAARSISMVPAAGLGYVLSTLALAAFAMPGEMQGADWVWAVLLGVVFVPVATCLMALGPRYIPAPEVALLILLEAILAPLLIWVVLREDPGPRALVGGAVVVSVLFVSNLIALRRQRPAARGPRRSRP